MMIVDGKSKKNAYGLSGKKNQAGGHDDYQTPLLTAKLKHPQCN